jgi:hypothetical protein
MPGDMSETEDFLAQREHRHGGEDASMRSSTPPWPGIRLPESFTPAWRLIRLSNRSPSTEPRTASTT